MGLLDNIQQYIQYYNELQLKDKIAFVGKSIGSKVIFSVLILVVLISDKQIPLKVRMVFIAALGYFILPMDLITDLLPVVGFTDDIAFLSYAISNAREYITPEVKIKAKQKLSKWMNVDDEEIIEDAEIINEQPS